MTLIEASIIILVCVLFGLWVVGVPLWLLIIHLGQRRIEEKVDRIVAVGMIDEDDEDGDNGNDRVHTLHPVK